MIAFATSTGTVHHALSCNSPLLCNANKSRWTCRTTVAPLHMSSSSPSSPSSTTDVSRRSLLSGMAALSMYHLVAGVDANAAESGQEGSAPIVLNTTTQGKGPTPVIGDLVGIRFKGVYNGVVFDNLFESTQPYFYRVGAGAVLLGIDEAVQQMKVGQVADITILPEKAFGSKGRRASPGKPAIPPNATVLYTIELSTIPGKEDELLEGVDDNDIGSSL